MTTKLTRRDSLKLAGGALLLATPFATRAAGDDSACVFVPEQTEGPYFVDDRLNRSDIRTDPRDGSRRPGMPLVLSFRVSRKTGGGCSPLPGATVDLWHCDAQGIYSDVRDAGFETLGQKFLRGYQLTGGDGAARFTTIYPGWYPGRAVHVHFKVRSGPSEFTSQLYFDDALSERIFTEAPYERSARAGQRLRNDDDGIYEDGGKELTLRLEPTGSGYAGRFHVALKV
jgi:protocatechuate 3,4-dioxygenase beta subunit